MIKKRSDSCVESVRAAFPKASKAAVQAIVDELNNERSKVFSRREDLTSEAFREKAARVLQDRQYRIAAARKEIAENLLKKQKSINFLTQAAFKNDPAEALKAKMGGTTRLTQSGNASMYYMEKGLLGKYLSALNYGLKEAGLTESMKNGVLDKPIMQELYEFRDGGKPGSSGSPEALQAAKIIRGVQSMMLEDLQKSGSSIRELDGYITRQSHNREAIQSAGFDQWVKDILPKLDMDRTFGASSEDPTSVLSTLKEVYSDIVTGRYGSAPVEGVSDEFVTVRGTSANLSAKTSKSRSIHFKDADSFYDYNQQYGDRNLMESVISTASKSARNSAMMFHFGTNPEGGYQALKVALQKLNADNPDYISKLKQAEPSIDRVFYTARGDYDAPGQGLGAKSARTLRAITSMSNLGFSFINSFNDLAGAAATLRAANGDSLLSNAMKLAQEYSSSFTSQAERSKWASRLGIYIDDMMGEMYSKFGAEDSAPGTLSKLQRIFYKLNGLELHTQAAKVATAKQFAMELADHAGTPFEGLSDRLQSTLGRYGIDSAMWKTVSRGVEEFDGVKAITPEGIRSIPDDFFQGGAREKFDAETKILSYLNDHADIGSSTQGLRTKALLLHGMKDEGLGVLLRLATQFKGILFTASDITKRVAFSNPETAPQSLKEAILKGKGDINGLAQFMLATTALSYLAASTKELAQGRTPKDPTDPKTLTDSFVKGGAMGMYGDFLLGEFDRQTGRTALKALAGPVLGQATDLVDLASQARQGKPFVGQTVKTLLHNVPFSNLYYTKGAFDYLILNQVNEALNPGYLFRLEQRAQQNPGLFSPNQSYLFYKPTGGQFQ